MPTFRSLCRWPHPRRPTHQPQSLSAGRLSSCRPLSAGGAWRARGSPQEPLVNQCLSTRMLDAHVTHLDPTPHSPPNPPTNQPPTLAPAQAACMTPLLRPPVSTTQPASATARPSSSAKGSTFARSLSGPCVGWHRRVGRGWGVRVPHLASLV